MAGFDNEVMFAPGERLETSNAQSIQLMQDGIASNVSRINFVGDPNGLVAANPSSISHDPNSGFLWLKISGTGTTVWQRIFAEPSGAIVKFTENTGTSLPDGSGNVNLLGPNSVLTGYSPWTVGSGSTATINMPGTVKWVVNATTNLGTHTTIQAAINAASSGDDIFITPGTYTENLTLKAGVNLTAFGSDSSLNGTGQVIISGTCTMTTAGSVTISGIQLQTNAAAAIVVSGSAASVLNIDNCYLNFTNSTGITYSSSSASSAIRMDNCNGNLGTTGIAIYTNTSSGRLSFNKCLMGNSGGSITPSTGSGDVVFFNSIFSSPFSTSTTGIINGTFYEINTSLQNVTCITTAGTGVMASVFAKFSSGSSSCISVGSGTAFNMYDCSLNSTNTNAFTGAGSTNYSMLSYESTGVKNNVTTPIIIPGSAFQTIAIQTFTSTGTYTPTFGMKYCQIEVVGGGGGGGGTAATSSTTGAAASGGGGGGYSKGIFTITQIGTSQAVTIPAAAAGGIGFNVGATGGTCSVGALITAIGGSGGQAAGASTSFSFAGAQGGGAGSGGSLNIRGGGGGASAFSISGSFILASSGGSSFYGAGALAAQGGNGTANVTNGNAGLDYGGGGGGSCAGTNGGAGAAAGTGGAGAKGVVVITEYV